LSKPADQFLLGELAFSSAPFAQGKDDRSCVVDVVVATLLRE
jgi:hypothetical protein